MKENIHAVHPDHNLILADTIAEAAVTPTETVPGNTTGTVNAITGVLPGAHTPMPIYIALAKTSHIEDYSCTEALPAYSRDYSRS